MNSPHDKRFSTTFRVVSASLAAGTAVGLVTLGAGPSTAASTTATTGSTETRTTYPPLLGWSSPDLKNDMRGQYVWDPKSKWSDESVTPLTFPQNNASVQKSLPGWPAVSTYYTRVTWRDLETSAGVYPDDNPLERRIAAAAARGQRTIFRVMMLDTVQPDTEHQAFPLYLNTTVPSWPYTFTHQEKQPDGSSKDVADTTQQIPDWNDPDYVAGVRRLIAHLGAKYDGDPRVAGFDLSGYGTWGEWHSYPWGGSMPAGFQEISPANVKAIVDATTAAFPRTQLFTLTDPVVLDTALAARPTMGIRVDCLGADGLQGAEANLSRSVAAQTRWKTAPFATEYCNTTGAAAERTFLNAQEQVRKYHVSLVSSGNFPEAYSDKVMSPDDWTRYQTAAKIAGYQYGTSSFTAPVSATRGSTISLSTQWFNAGSAPVYSKPSVYLELRPAGTTTLAASVRSSIDLTTLVSSTIPATGVYPETAYRTATDTLTIPAGIPAGQYDVTVAAWPSYAKQPNGSVPGLGWGLNLAQGDRTPDGHYRLGTITID